MKMLAALTDYLDSIKARDPAPRSRWEILLYAGVHAVALHKVAHWLYQADLHWIARLVSQTSRFFTGIEIHPGAKVGRNFFIDHGMGVVIGETAVIGDDVTLYHGVTLGGIDPSSGIGGKRHPTLHDGCIVGSGAQILGPVTIGKSARIGANSVVTKDVLEGATMIGIPARALLVDAEKFSSDFIAYGTPCADQFDPQTQKVELLKCEIETLRKRLKQIEGALEADSGASGNDALPRKQA